MKKRDILTRREMLAQCSTGFGMLALQGLMANSAFMGVELATAEDATGGGYLEVKFDGNKLRAYGPATSADIGIAVSSVTAGTWIKMEYILNPSSQTLELKVNGASIRTMPLRNGPWTRISNFGIKGCSMGI